MKKWMRYFSVSEREEGESLIGRIDPTNPEAGKARDAYRKRELSRNEDLVDPITGEVDPWM